MKFDFSLWNYTQLGENKVSVKKTIQDYKELGITVGFSYDFQKNSKKNDMIKMLNYAQKSNISLIISDYRTNWKSLETYGEEVFTAMMREAIKDFSRHKACKGFYLGDEPPLNKMEVYMKACEIFKTMSDKTPFINFFPFNNCVISDYKTRDNYLKQIDKFNKIGIDIIAFDRYSQLHYCEYEKDFIKNGIIRYYDDLNMFVDYSKKVGHPCWTSLLSVGHWMYKTPDINNLRWQINTAIAHGVNGIQWFFVYQHRWADDYYNYPIRINGEKTQLFKDMCYVTEECKNKVLNKLCGYTHKKTYHITDAMGDTPLLEKGDEKYYVFSDHGMNGIFSVFENEQKHKKYLIVNADQEKPELFYIQDINDKKEYIWLSSGGTHLIEE